ncbi:MAG: NAD-dependent malic enzyme, partial [Pedosphaera sp.]|nr:NAD-dependent malic enzyme [Pedosphaera sp.]
PSELLKQGLLYPLQSNILESEIQTAARVAKLVFDSGLAGVARPAGNMEAFIRKQVYKPEYVTEAKVSRAKLPARLSHRPVLRQRPRFSFARGRNQK